MARDERSPTATDDGQAEPRALGTFRRTTRRKCCPPSEVRTQDKGVGHVMEKITETLPARAVVRVSQLVGRAGGGSKVKSFAHEHHRSPADRLAGLRGGRRMAAKSSWKRQQIDVADVRTVEHTVHNPVPGTSSSSSKARERTTCGGAESRSSWRKSWSNSQRGVSTQACWHTLC